MKKIGFCLILAAAVSCLLLSHFAVPAENMINRRTEAADPEPSGDPAVLLNRLLNRGDWEGGISSRYLGDYSGTPVYSVYFIEDEEVRAFVEETVAGYTFYNDFAANPYPLAIYAVKNSALVPLADAFGRGLLTEDDIAVLRERDMDAKDELYGRRRGPEYRRIREILCAVNFRFKDREKFDTLRPFSGLLTDPQEWDYAGLDEEALNKKYGPYCVMPESAVESRARDFFGDGITVVHGDFYLGPDILYDYQEKDHVYVYAPTGGRRTPEPYITDILRKGDTYTVCAFFLIYPGEYEDYKGVQSETGSTLMETLPNRLPLTMSQAYEIAGELPEHEYVFRKENGRLILISCGSSAAKKKAYLGGTAPKTGDVQDGVRFVQKKTAVRRFFYWI